MNTTQIGVGLVLIAVSSVALFASGSLGPSLPLLTVAAFAALGLAAGTLLVGTSSDEPRAV